ncbi:helix-turn-helix transcriptional regulator [Paraburkholderia sp. MM5477-R1]|uniref:helix-turn-helix transcriptional regulator n=1 Tax=Paraburkholderia sp. MM5477-R1 TaxID=2991062 RepID=UPI003D256E73
MTIEELLLTRLPYVNDTEEGSISSSDGISFGDIYAFICDRMDPPPSRRTVRRVLSSMTGYVDHVGHTRGPRWFKVQGTVMLRSGERMNVNLAIALCALKRVAAQHLPAAVFAELAPKSAEARATLELDGNNELAVSGRSWSNKVTRIVGTQPLVFPSLDVEVYRNVTDALLRNRKLSFKYENSDCTARVDRTYKDHSPLGMIDRAGVFDLITREPAQGTTRMFRVDRIREATGLTSAAVPCEGFDLESFATKMMHFLPEPEIELRLRIHVTDGDIPRTAAQHILNEFKLHKDQPIDWNEDGKSFVLTATVSPSVMLRQFLRSQSDSIEVLSPAGMRAKFAARVRRMDDRYAQEPCEN